MLIKRESDYGIRIVRALQGGEKLSVKEICKAESIPEAFTYKILKKMQMAGIVKSVRGVDGGYLLSKALNDITLYHIMLAVEPDFSVISCMSEGCSRNTNESPCLVHGRLVEVQKGIVELLSQKTIAEILGLSAK